MVSYTRDREKQIRHVFIQRILENIRVYLPYI
jgi:hypothetical protein